jgi:imidazolonepropionase-like amidohydrolase
MQVMNQPKEFILRAERLFASKTGELLKDGSVVVSGNRIVESGLWDKISAKYQGVPVQSFPGCTMFPGLIDTHVHLTFSASQAPFKQIQEDTDFEMQLRGVANARSALEAGITTIRDLGSRNSTIFELKRAIEKGHIRGPSVLGSGRPITSIGGHLHFLGGARKGVKAVTELAEELVEEGADVIKVMATGGNMTAGSDPLKAQFSLDELKAIVAVANAAKIPVTVHARGIEGIRISVLAGVHGVEHARMESAPGVWGFDTELAKMMADRGVVTAPTLAASFRALQAREAGHEVGVRTGAVPIADRLKNAARLRESGIDVVVGTDAGAALARFEEAVDIEMELLVKAGWSPSEALQAATIGAARALRLGDSIGALDQGYRADILLVRGDPTRNISDIRQVEAVFKDGCLAVRQGSILDERRQHPWPLDEIEQRPSLFAALN